LREANRLLSASRCWSRSKVPAVTIAGTGTWVHSAFGRSTVLTARGTERLLRVARTIADLEGTDRVLAAHLDEAARFRTPARSLADQLAS